ncbi:GDSL family lipase [Nostoc sp. 'Peltigera membranacea cyanobiont' 210A]|uniref:SGNH/GDSL hydrolase family protein n=1 Tax=Nostoc sp. 'Peltigera membranacea cyanobiont' 210A TaxID=2014529 RepID=UPI000B95A345|nr:SGNH/GDSL hydrolase family protein [Nostoc sp. 'Peltigera membranacea cyanobiont' 210A]OYD96584.1 GDSL family lipase [Nostoc sp. 'Peltigera membranacea cyanobiont' 210A]
MQKEILAAGFYLLSLIFPLKVSAKDYDEIYVFGDSFSDTGNVFNATNGIVPPNPPYFNKRFSNGPVWVEYLASNLRLTFNPNTNFAFGGATTGFKNIGISTLPGLQQQINSFTIANPSADPNSLYILWAGINDYLDYFFQGTPNPTQSVTNLSTAVKSLAAVGARDIMVLNLPDLGKFPVTSGNRQISSLLSTFTSKHNSSLTKNLNLLSQELNPNIKIIPLDINSLFNRIIAEPEEFSLMNGTDSCIGDSPVVPIEVTTQPVICIPDKFLFWDEIHPTTATHKLIGKLAFSALKPVSVPESSAVLGVLAFSVGAVSLRKHK